MRSGRSLERPLLNLGTDMSDWSFIALKALRNLGADSVMVPGAKLRLEMESVGAEMGFSVPEYLASSDEPFGALVEQVEEVVVIRRPGTDMLVGVGAAGPPQGPSTKRSVGTTGSLRRDVFEAFTRLSNVAFVYLPETDRFVPENLAQGRSIPVPETNLDGLVRDREDFARSQDSQAQPALLAALTRSSKPLADFHRVLSETDLLSSWAATQGDLLRERVTAWAREHDIQPRDSWFTRDRSRPGTRYALEQLIPYLTAEEIRELKIPFRAVEALIADRSRN